MANRPEQLEIVDRLVASTNSNHFYAFRLHRELVQRGAAGDHAANLLGESAQITLQQIPLLTRDWHVLAREWSETELLDPTNLDSVTHAIQVRFAELRPKLEGLTRRQDQITAELIRLAREAPRT
jgi:hypothetical protein